MCIAYAIVPFNNGQTPRTKTSTTYMSYIDCGDE